MTVFQHLPKEVATYAGALAWIVALVALPMIILNLVSGSQLHQRLAESKARFTQACQERGGVTLTDQYGPHCIRKDAVIDLGGL
jgi:hypothetical protein